MWYNLTFIYNKNSLQIKKRWALYKSYKRCPLKIIGYTSYFMKILKCSFRGQNQDKGTCYHPSHSTLHWRPLAIN